ncbi:hypothetical protein [Pontibacter populi]|uniref:Uncharacterized protein n=1 Tax=Pontibacter populi TaxID=890055 RepID=A0ABV1RT68_9BACT
MADWTMVIMVTFLNDEVYKAFVPIEETGALKRGLMVLIMPKGSRDGEDFATIIARKANTEEDFDIMFLKEQYGKEHEIFTEAFNSYKHRIHNAWKRIKGLEVHHRYYKVGALPWEYPDGALTTLCWYCHEELHKNGKVPVLDRNGNVIGEYTNCTRCYGAGVFPEFSHVQSGICFRCNGAKYEELIDS